ncbi:HNH endonuclease [Corynebacterium diphtheriae]|nr:HNH endonuclease [Corynebacterium diphtheriae]
MGGTRALHGPPLWGGGMSKKRWGGRRAQKLVALTLASYGTRCHLCGCMGATTADHVIPRSHGGNDSLENLRPAHLSCNAARGNLPLTEWFRAHPLHVEAVKPSPRWNP